MTLVTLTMGRSFDIPVGCSILDAAAQSQVLLPYSCKTGRCSACKCKVVKGKTIAMNPEVGLTEGEKAQGWILSCARTAVEDVLINVEDLLEVTLPAVKTLPCRISSLEYLAGDVLRVMLRLPPTTDFKYIAGQYIDVIGPNGVRRSYSLANSYAADNLLELHIRAVDGGVLSEYWFNHAKVNDLLRLYGPLGTFFVRDTANIDMIFLATGTGIAPIKALLEFVATLPQDKKPKSTTVFWGARVPQDLYLDINAIPGQHQFFPVLSRPPISWTGVRGYVQQAFLAKNPNMNNIAVYACGSDAMIKEAKVSLAAAGLPTNRFYSDAFVCSASN